MPKIKNWIFLNAKLKEDLKNLPKDIISREAELRNIINSLNNLKGYPFIKKLKAVNEIEIVGLYFDIGKGEVLLLDEKLEIFIPFI